MKKDIAVAFSILLMCFLSAYLFFTGYVNLDTANALYESKLILSGGKYFYDFFETSPPMFLYVFFPVVFVMRWFPALNFQYALFFYFLFLSLFSITLCRLLSSNRILILVITFALIITGVCYFGQREEISIALTLPYFFLLSNRLEKKAVNTYFSLLIGFLAGIGFATKPHFCIPFFLSEGYEPADVDDD